MNFHLIYLFFMVVLVLKTGYHIYLFMMAQLEIENPKNEWIIYGMIFFIPPFFLFT